MKSIVLTGIKPTGNIHIGNYFGAIKPCLDMIKSGEHIVYLFVANYHALNTIKSAKDIKELTFNAACTYLACGLKPENVVFYKQSNVSAITEICSILTNVTPKGLMNRAHAYKATVDKNIIESQEQDAGINMGLYNYPILMAADILTFNAGLVPVGQDQKQHIEIARDIASSFNSIYGKTFTLPEPLIDNEVKSVIGLDGRKMSKSYSNELSLFADSATIKKFVSKIVTDSSLPSDPKPLDHTILELYKLVQTKEKYAQLVAKFKCGISWAEAKQTLLEALEQFIAPIREKYNYYKQNEELVNNVLAKGAETANKYANLMLEKVKAKVGCD